MLGNTAVECFGEGGLVRPIHAQPLASKCRAEPTDMCTGGRSIRGLQRPATGRSAWLVSDHPMAKKCRVEATVSGWGAMWRCRLTRQINTRQFLSCPSKGQLVERPATGETNAGQSVLDLKLIHNRISQFFKKTVAQYWLQILAQFVWLINT